MKEGRQKKIRGTDCKIVEVVRAISEVVHALVKLSLNYFKIGVGQCDAKDTRTGGLIARAEPCRLHKFRPSFSSYPVNDQSDRKMPLLTWRVCFPFSGAPPFWITPICQESLAISQ
jgi:hypothetical protein